MSAPTRSHSAWLAECDKRKVRSLFFPLESTAAVTSRQSPGLRQYSVGMSITSIRRPPSSAMRQFSVTCISSSIATSTKSATAPRDLRFVSHADYVSTQSPKNVDPVAVQQRAREQNAAQRVPLHAMGGVAVGSAEATSRPGPIWYDMRIRRLA